MAATITGIVFNDSNHNGVLDPGESGIGGVYVYLGSTSGYMETVTDASGNYSFSVAAAGTYTIYETVTQQTPPPTIFSQPPGFNVSNGPRQITLSVTAANVSGNAVLSGFNFSHDTNTAALTCDSTFIQFVGDPTQWVNIDLVTGVPVIQGYLTPPDYVNALGFNVLDDYLYGYDLTTNTIVRIDEQGIIMNLGLPVGLPVTAQQYNTGCFDDQGFLYLYYGGAARFYVIDLRPNSPTFMMLVSPLTNYTAQTGSYGIALVNGTPNIADWVWLPANPQTDPSATAVNGFLYGIQTGGVMARVNLDNAHVINMTTSGPTYSSSYGALAVDINGNIYAVANQNGNIYRYTISGTTATGNFFSNTYFDSHNDGAMCRQSQPFIDFGDAPDQGIGAGPVNNYNTLLANNGPRHQIVNGLTIGVTITAEEDALQNADATGDVDDGVATPLPVLSPSTASYTVSVVATNNLSAPANLYGWIDFNQNGLFEPSESVLLVIPALSGTQTYSLTFANPFPGVLTNGKTFLRLRLTTDSLAQGPDNTGQDLASIGPASNGEVEDYIIYVGSNSDLQLTKTVDKDAAYIGDPLTYNVTVTNLGPDTATGVLLVDSLPPELNNPVFSVDNGATWQVGLGSLALPDLAVGQSYTVLIQGTINFSAGSSITNAASVSSVTSDPDLTNNQDQAVTTVLPSADLSVTKLTQPAEAVAGVTTLTYLIEVANAGPNDASNVILTDPVPPQIENPMFSDDNQATWHPWTGYYPAIQTLPANSNFTLYIRGLVAPNSPDLTNSASVSSDTFDPNPSNNSSQAATPVTLVADLGIQKSDSVSPNPVMNGNPLTYTLTVTNYGPDDASDIVITDTTPQELVNPQFSVDGSNWNPWNGSYTLASLPADPSANTFNLYISGIISAASAGVIQNSASVGSAAIPDPNPDNDSTTINTAIGSSADLSIVKTSQNVSNGVGEDIGDVGSLFTYYLAVANNGPDPAVNAVVTDTIPSDLGNVQYSLDGGTTWLPWAGSLNLGTLPVQSLTIEIQGTIITPDLKLLNNTASVSSDTPDIDPTNNSSTLTIDLRPPADLAVVKASAMTQAVAGSPLTYEITITNNGPEPAIQTILTENLPAGLLNPQFSLDGVNWSPFDTTIAIGDLPAGNTAVCFISATVDPALNPVQVQNLVNNVSVSSDTPDHNLSNNSDQLSLPLTAAADLSVEKTLQGQLVAGQTNTYQFLVTNNGPSTATSVVLVDAFPAPFSNLEFSVDGSPMQPLTSNSQLGDIAPGQTVTLIIQGDLGPAVTGKITNSSLVHSTVPDPNRANNRSSTTSEVQQECFLVISKTAAPTQVSSGGMLTYTLTVLNQGPSTAQNVTLIDVIPPELSSVSFSTDGINWTAPWTGSYTYPVIPVGGARTLLIQGTVTSSQPSAITNTVHVQSDTPNMNPVTDSTVQTNVDEEADLHLTKVASINHITPGGTLVYTLAVTNLGPSDAEDVVITDTPPAGLLDISYSFDQTSWQPWTGSIDIGTLPNGQTATLYLQGTVAPDAADELINSAMVNSQTTFDPDLSNNSASYEVYVGQASDLQIVKTANTDTASPGDMLTYTLTITNNGPSDVTDAQVNDDLPSWFLNPQVSTDGTTWQPWATPYPLPLLADGDTFSLQVQGQVDPGFSGSGSNIANVSSSLPDPDPTNNTSHHLLTVTPQPQTNADVGISKTADSFQALPGDLVTYTLTATNYGPADAPNVQVQDNCPLDNPQYSIDGGYGWSPWSGVFLAGTLTAGSSAVLLIRGTIPEAASGFVQNTATITSDATDPNPANNQSTYHVVISPPDVACPLADLVIAKAVDLDAAAAGSLATYSLDIANNGPDTASNVVVSDSVGELLSDPVYSLDGGSTWGTWNGQLAFGDMSAGYSARILIQGTLLNDGDAYNTASITSDTPDPNPADNSSTYLLAGTPVPPQAPAPVTVFATGCSPVAKPGHPVSYHIIISNPGKEVAKNVCLPNEFSSCICQLKYSWDECCWCPWDGELCIGDLEPESYRILKVKGIVSNCAKGTLCNVIKATSQSGDHVMDSNSFTLKTRVAKNNRC